MVPHFLGEQDHPWLRVLLEEHERFIGRPQRELDARLREPLPCESPPVKLRLAVQVLARLHRSHRNRSAVPPRKARALVFETAARAKSPAPLVLSSVAENLGVTPRDLSDSLFADLPGERLVGPASASTSPGELALRINLALVQALLSHAARVRIDVEGHTRSLVRHARLRGLICTVTERGGEGRRRPGAFRTLRALPQDPPLRSRARRDHPDARVVFSLPPSGGMCPSRAPAHASSSGRAIPSFQEALHACMTAESRNVLPESFASSRRSGTWYASRSRSMPAGP